MRCLRGCAALLAVLLVASIPPSPAAETAPPDEETVGRHEADRAVTPVNQVLTPHGVQVDLPGMRPQALALSPDGRLLAASGKSNELVLFDAKKQTVQQTVGFPSDRADLAPQEPVSPQILRPDRESQVSYTGLVFSPSGDRLYLSNVEGLVEVFAVAEDDRVKPLRFWTLPTADAPRRATEIPAGLAVSDDGRRVYVCGNLSNRLLEIDAASGKTLRKFAVGVAPYDVLLKNGKAYVSNWGGRRPGEGDLVGPAGRGTVVRVDPEKHVASEGSVSVVDLSSGKVVKEILTGLHASGLAASSAHDFVVCCNAASDNLSVIDSRTDELVATIWTKPNAADLLGAAPNAAAFDPSGRRLLVANGSQNAIAVVDFDAERPKESRLAGMFPVGWYPGAVLFDAAGNQVLAANIKGLPAAPKYNRGFRAEGFNSHHYYGSITFSPLPEADELKELSAKVAANLRAPRIEQALAPPRSDQPPRAVPERIGEPSKIKHVIYVIKENRTYDQVFGELAAGNGDKRLCIFGRRFTPNQHRLAEEFVLLDNAYCCGILSADGHQWSTTAYSTDYMEKSFAGFPRSYPDGMGEDEDDALAYAPSGFLWDNALKHGKTVRNYGEFMAPLVRWKDEKRSGGPDFAACYRAWQDRDNKDSEVVFESRPSVETLRKVSPTGYVGWSDVIPDQWRAEFVLRELAEFEKRGEYPALTIICLPQDHTCGTSPGSPTPGACVADNDLAFGRIVAALSRSKFWPEMAIFAIEDDPQGGWDHVSGYRTIAFCISPYAKRKAVVSTQYNTTSLIRTMEQILGLPPMNQFDASAEPMFDCFQEEADLASYEIVPANLALDEMNPDPQAIVDPRLREDAIVSSRINFKQVDRAPEDVLNRILWRAMRGSQTPYPEWAVTHIDEDEDEEEESELD
jgi:DNA-binding beta-propeller fold protein YncE